MIDLSVIVLSWNTRALTLECLARVERELVQGGGLRIETLVVDNGSTDGTAEAVRAQAPWAETVALPGNLGFAAGNNVALRRCRGRHALLLNSDTLVTGEAVRRCVGYLDAHPDVGVVGPQLLHPDGRLQNSVHVHPTLLTLLVPKALLEWLRPARYPSKRRPPATPIDVEAVLGACLFVRREAWESAGLLPERDFFLFLEETDWCWTLRDAGWRVVHLPDARVVHLSGGSSKKKVPARTRIEYHRALYRFFAKRRGRIQTGIAVAIGVMKGSIAVLGRVPAALGSARGRERLRERWDVLVWHLRGRPEGAGLETEAYRAHRAALGANEAGAAAGARPPAGHGPDPARRRRTASAPRGGELPADGGTERREGREGRP